nr:MAG: hypothetical protein [uncultured archaeon]
MENFRIKAKRGKSIHKFNLLAKNEEEAIKKAKELTHYEFKIFIINKIKYLKM